MPNKPVSLYLFVFVSIVLSNCQNSQSAEAARSSSQSFAARFNEKYEDVDLLLSFIIYAAEKTKGLNIDSANAFYAISSQFSKYNAYPAGENIDSSLDAFVAANKNVDFTSPQAQQRIYQIKNSLYIVGDIIEGDINDDGEEDKLKLLEGKIDSLPEIATIYRRYVPKDRQPGSLSSSEGSSLLIHVAYYFSLEDTHKRNELLKKLL